MTLTELRYVVAVAETRHFGHAAERCHVSQPSLSASVKNLEEELGVTLFERGKRGVFLTEAGEQIVAQEGYVLAVRIKEDKSTYNSVEDLAGRMVTLRAGDVLAGTLGTRRALRGSSGTSRWRRRNRRSRPDSGVRPSAPGRLRSAPGLPA